MSQNKNSCLEYSYEYDNSIYKHKLDSEFIVGNQTMISISLIHAFEYLSIEKSCVIKKIRNIKGLPLITYQSDDENSSLLLVVPFYENEIIAGISKSTISNENRLKEVVNETLKIKAIKHQRAEIMFLNYVHIEQKECEKIITPFGFMFMSKPTIVSLEK